MFGVVPDLIDKLPSGSLSDLPLANPHLLPLARKQPLVSLWLIKQEEEEKRDEDGNGSILFTLA